MCDPGWRRPVTAGSNGRMHSDRLDIALPSSVRARLLGAFLAAIGVVLVATAALVALARWDASVLAGMAVLALAGMIVLGLALVRRRYVLRLDEHGYRLRFVRGAGVSAARWSEVEDLSTTTAQGSAGGADCVVLRLRDGRTTTIPVTLLAMDRERFVEELRRRLDSAHGYRRLG